MEHAEEAAGLRTIARGAPAKAAKKRTGEPRALDELLKAAKLPLPARRYARTGVLLTKAGISIDETDEDLFDGIERLGTDLDD